MLTRSTDLTPRDTLTNEVVLTPPSFSQSVFHNFAQGYTAPLVGANMLDSHFAASPEGEAMRGAYEAVNLENQTPGLGTGQWLVGQGANLLGMSLNPVNWGLGKMGSLAARGIAAGAEKLAPEAVSMFMRRPLKEILGEKLGKWLPEMVGKEGEGKTLSSALMSEKTWQLIGEHGASAAAFMAPISIMENYNNDTHHIQWGGVARSMGEMGAFGIAIGSIPFTWGLMRGKINRATGRGASEVVAPHDIDRALEKGHITEAEHAWYTDYHALQKDPGNQKLEADLKERGSRLINENGHRANTVTNEAMFEILTPDDVSNLQGVVADQIAGNVPENFERALSDFVIHGRLDYIRQKPEWLDGVRGYVDFINEKLGSKEAKLREADEILDKHLLRSVKENMPFSQKEIIKHAKQAGLEESHLSQMPLSIPKNVQKHVGNLQKIAKLKAKVQKDVRAGREPNKKVVKRMEDLEKGLPKILTPKEELVHLKGELFKEKGLIDHVERTPAYHRLADLAHVWNNARVLLDRVHLENEYKKQSAFKELSDSVLKTADSDFGKLAKPDDVMNYMRSRLEKAMSEGEKIEDVKRVLADSQKVPADSEAILTDQAERAKNTAAEDAKQEFEESSARFDEFKKSENVFKNLISCVLGGING